MNQIRDNYSKFCEYTTEAQWFLSSCQTIEAGLRGYIIASYDFIRLSLDNKLPFHLNEQDIKKDSMGTLIDKFSKLSNNSDLVSRLRQLVPLRNKCAHHAFVLKVSSLRSENSQFESDTIEVKEMFDRSESVYAEVADAYKSVKKLLKAAGKS